MTSSAYNWNDSRSPYETLGLLEFSVFPNFYSNLISRVTEQLTPFQFICLI